MLVNRRTEGPYKYTYQTVGQQVVSATAFSVKPVRERDRKTLFTFPSACSWGNAINNVGDQTSL